MPNEAMQKLIKDELDIFRQSDGWPSEFDIDMNVITIEKIKLFAQLNNNGHCYLGKVNRYQEDKSKPYMVPYDGQQVFNFEHTFMIPVYDEKLVELIRDREHAEYTGTKDDYRRVSEIMDRIQELGGMYLFWV